MMEALVGMITKHLKKGERVKIAGLGVLQVRSRAARMGRNPATGDRRCLGHASITNTVSYTAMRSEPFKDFWR